MQTIKAEAGLKKVKFESHNLASAQTAWALVGIDALVQVGHGTDPQYQPVTLPWINFLSLFAFRHRTFISALIASAALLQSSSEAKKPLQRSERTDSTGQLLLCRTKAAKLHLPDERFSCSYAGAILLPGAAISHWARPDLS
ncbi:hypothetical protein ACFIOY_40065 [Bradyrhizobium sp. TZ2]